MGSLGAQSMAEFGGVNRGTLHWHLRSNHYPPIPESMIDPCLEAIDHAAADDWDVEVDLPEGITYRDQTTCPVSAMVEQHHLDAFVEAKLYELRAEAGDFEEEGDEDGD